jgi:ATP-dependent Lon protease
MTVMKRDVVLPLIPLRELVSFPSAIIPILVGRERSLNALKYAREQSNNYIFLSVQTNQISENPSAAEIAEVGIIARVEKSGEQVNGSFRAIIQGLERATIREFVNEDDYFLVRVSPLEEIKDTGKQMLELSRELIAMFEEYVTLKKVRLHGIVAKLQPNQVSEITDVIVSVINIPISIKQSLLEELNVRDRATKVYNILKKEVFRLRAESGVKEPRKPREESAENDIEEYKRKIENAEFPDYVKKNWNA